MSIWGQTIIIYDNKTIKEKKKKFLSIRPPLTSLCITLHAPSGIIYATADDEFRVKKHKKDWEKKNMGVTPLSNNHLAQKTAVEAVIKI